MHALNPPLGENLKCLCHTVVSIAVLVCFSVSIASLCSFLILSGILSHRIPEGGKGHPDLVLALVFMAEAMWINGSKFSFLLLDLS